MSIYKIMFEHGKFMSFYVPNEELFAKMGRDFIFHADSSPIPQKDRWVAPDASFYKPDDLPSATGLPDITNWGSSKLVINEKVRKAINFEEAGEVLPVFCEGIPYYVINILTIAGDNTIDHEKSKQNLVEGHYMGIDALTFIEDKVKDYLIFRTKFDGCIGIYCTDRFKNLVEDGGFKGIRFSENLVSIF